MMEYPCHKLNPKENLKQFMINMRKQASKIKPADVFLGFDSTKKLSVGAAIDGGERKLRHRQNSYEIRGLGIWGEKRVRREEVGMMNYLTSASTPRRFSLCLFSCYCYFILFQ